MPASHWREIVNRRARFESFEVRALMSADPVSDFHLDYTAEAFGAAIDPLAERYGFTGLTSVRTNYGLTGAGQTVAVIDTGIAYDHPALGGGFGTSYRVVGGWDFTPENDANPYDDGAGGSHGTHVAGIIGGADSANTGVAPGVDLVALRVFDDAGKGLFSWVEKALQWVHTNRNAFENPITTVNLSLGTTWNSSSIPAWSTLEDEFAQLKADGIFIAVAAGNSFTTYNAPGLSYPAASPSVVPVASVDDSGALSYFSQRDQRVIAAPGRSIRSTVPDYVGDLNRRTDDYASYSGTSMASPFVAGASVLLRQALQFAGRTNINQDTIYNIMRQTADVIYDSVTKQNYFSLNVGRAIDSIMPADDFGSTVATAHRLTGGVHSTVSGMIGRLGDRDYFTFTAAATGVAVWSMDTSDGFHPALELAGGAGSTTPEGTFTFNVVAGQTYTVGVSAGQELGRYSLELNTLQTAENLGALDYRAMSGLNVSGERSFSVTATRDALLTVQATFSQAGGNVDVEIYNSQGVLLASSATSGSTERLDVAAHAGETFVIRLVGNNASVNLRLANLVNLDGTRATVWGSGGVDSFTYTAASRSFEVNGLGYQIDGTGKQYVTFAGDGDASVELLGSSYADTVVMRNASATMTSAAYDVLVSGAPTIRVQGGGGVDFVALYDSIGDNAFSYSSSRASLQGGGIHYVADGFTRVDAYASTGNDTAQLFDSAGDDVFGATPTFAEMYRRTSAGIQHYGSARGFDFVQATATSGGDTAWLYDSAGNDVLTTRPTSAELVGTGFRNSVAGFDRVMGIASAGGNDQARMYDSAGNDTLIASPSFVELLGAGFYNTARGFDHVTASASAGGVDQAALYDSAGDDAFVAMPNIAEMKGTGFYNSASGFDRVTGIANAGGNDTAWLWDSAGDDVFGATSNYAELRGAGFFNTARGFERVQGIATAGGNDTAWLYDSSGNDRLIASPTFVELLGAGFYNSARGFDRVNAIASAGGNDEAWLYDSAGNDVFDATPTFAQMQGIGFYNSARGFDKVTGNASAGGNDIARLWDSIGDDSFGATPNYAEMRGAGFYNAARGFDEVHGMATAGGNDSAWLYDSVGDDIYRASPGYAEMSSRTGGYENTASGFDRVTGVSSRGGNDEAYLWDSAGVDELVAAGDQAALSGQDFMEIALGFQRVTVQFDQTSANKQYVGPTNFTLVTAGNSS